MIYAVDDRRECAIPGNAQETLTFCVEHFLKACQESIAQKGSFYVALSGGSTPKILFSRLTSEPIASQIEWQKVHLFWSDERTVPPTDPDSNYHMAMEAGFKQVPIPPSQIHRMEAEKELEGSALAYEKLLPKQFDYLMLGMGEDGHTASLFPGTKGLECEDRRVIANFIPQKNTWRMTLTFPCINASKQIVFYVLGKNKQEKAQEALSSKILYPAQEVGTPLHKALWILDEEAATLARPSLVLRKDNGCR